MGLFSKLMTEKITAAAVRSQQIVEPKKQVNARSIKEQIVAISEKVKEHFPDSKAELITSAEQLHTYIDHMIVCGIGAIDTETTGLDSQKDHIVGWSLYYPDGTEVYIPCKHIVPIFDTPYANQLTYEQCGAELQRLVSAKTKLVMANADFDLSMIWRDFKVDLVDIIFFDVILAWRCLKENEKDNTLKGLYTKYVVRGTIDKMKFNDFFSPELYPYCDPQIAKLYAAADARYTFELFKWQMQYLTKNNPKCEKYKFDAISDLYFGIENPLIKVCQMMHRRGVYLEQSVADMLKTKYNNILKEEEIKLQRELQGIIDNPNYYTSVKAPFGSVNDFNPNSGPHVEWLVYDLLKLDTGTKKRTTNKDILGNFNVPIIKNILKYRSLVTLISTFVRKLPKVAAEAPDGKIHCEFKSIGADCVTGDTIIPTRNGYFTAKDLCHKAEATPKELIPTEPFSIISMNNSYDYATDVIYYPDTPTIKVTTECGLSIEGTPNHPIICTVCVPIAHSKGLLRYDTADWVKLEDVVVGHYVKIPCNYRGNKDARLQPTGLVPIETSRRAKSVTVPMYISAEFAEFLGMYHADGSAYFAPNSYRIKISNKDVDVQNRVIYLTSKLFGVHPTVDKHKKRPDAIDTSINCLALSCMDKLLCHGASKKRIPKAIWLSPTDVINSYIRGMTLDSAVVLRDNNTRFLLSVANDEDASLIQQHLISQGILCSKQKGHPLKGGSSTLLYFNADNYALFRDTIGFIQTSKVVYDIPPMKHPHSKRVGDYFYLKVKSIEHRRADVYDLSVPNTHSFVGNAIICHNTGRFSSRTPNMQNIPSKNGDIRRMFRASPGYVMMSSDYSQQEPKLTAYISGEPLMIDTFKNGRDIYATIASIAFGYPYEECLEFHPETHEYQPDGKLRRTRAKPMVLGINYGMEAKSLGEKIFGDDKSISEEERTATAKKVFDAVMTGFPVLKQAIAGCRMNTKRTGYTETILGRRRHLPNIQLPQYEFKPKKGYINPDIDPLNPATFQGNDGIPQRIQDALLKELKSYKYKGQVYRRIRELSDVHHIKVIDNSKKIAEAERESWNAVVQGSAAELTKMAMLRLENDPEWIEIGGRLILPVHDELIVEVPFEYRDKGAKILKRSMEEAGSFLPFAISCDIEMTFRWYGLAVDDILSFEVPTEINFDTLSESNIKWLQSCLFEQGYVMPVYKNEDGSKPIGNAAKGINGKVSDELKEAYADYMAKYGLSTDAQFIKHIDTLVKTGEMLSIDML